MSELFQECPYKTYKEWRQWYLSRKPNAIADATQRIKTMVGNLRAAIVLIDDNDQDVGGRLGYREVIHRDSFSTGDLEPSSQNEENYLLNRSAR